MDGMVIELVDAIEKLCNQGRWVGAGVVPQLLKSYVSVYSGIHSPSLKQETLQASGSYCLLTVIIQDR